MSDNNEKIVASNKMLGISNNRGRRIPFVDHKIVEKARKFRKENPEGSSPEKEIKIYSRASFITKDFVGLYVRIHNGKIFHRVFIIPSMIGHKFGEFSKTRTFGGHPEKNKKGLKVSKK